MDPIFDKLKNAGCDIDGAMRRFVNNEDLYLSFLPRTLDDPAFAALAKAVHKQDAPAAFQAAHTLKGLYGNMGLTPLYTICRAMVEPLRTGSLEGCADHFAALQEELLRLRTLIS